MAMRTKFILFFSLYLAYKRISFYIKIITYHLSFKFESQNEDRWSNFAKIFIFLLSNGVFPMLLTENTTNDTCQSNLRGAWKWRDTGTQRTKESLRVPPLYTLWSYIVVREAVGACLLNKQDSCQGTIFRHSVNARKPNLVWSCLVFVRPWWPSWARLWGDGNEGQGHDE
jgi:hypothetical protein